MANSEMDDLYTDVFQIPEYGTSPVKKKAKYNASYLRSSQPRSARDGFVSQNDESSVDLYGDLSMDSIHFNDQQFNSPKKRGTPNLVKDQGQVENKTPEYVNNLDMYSDLLTSELTEKEQLKQQLFEIKSLNEKLLQENQELKKTKEQLSKNISSLFLTAKKELQKKDEEITSLKRSLDEQKSLLAQKNSEKQAECKQCTFYEAERQKNKEHFSSSLETRRRISLVSQDDNPNVTKNSSGRYFDINNSSPKSLGDIDKLKQKNTDKDLKANSVDKNTLEAQLNKPTTPSNDNVSFDLRSKLKQKLTDKLGPAELKSKLSEKKGLSEINSKLGDRLSCFRPTSEGKEIMTGRESHKSLASTPKVVEHFNKKLSNKVAHTTEGRSSGNVEKRYHSEIRDRLQQEINQSYSLAACKGVATRRMTKESQAGKNNLPSETVSDKPLSNISPLSRNEKKVNVTDSKSSNKPANIPHTVNREKVNTISSPMSDQDSTAPAHTVSIPFNNFKDSISDPALTNETCPFEVNHDSVSKERSDSVDLSSVAVPGHDKNKRAFPISDLKSMSSDICPNVYLPSFETTGPYKEPEINHCTEVVKILSTNNGVDPTFSLYESRSSDSKKGSSVDTRVASNESPTSNGSTSSSKDSSTQNSCSHSSDSAASTLKSNQSSSDSDKNSNCSSIQPSEKRASLNEEFSGTKYHPVSNGESCITCTSNLILLGDEETTCTTFSPCKPNLLPSEFYPPGVRACVQDKGSHARHIRGQPEVIHTMSDLNTSQFITGSNENAQTNANNPAQDAVKLNADLFLKPTDIFRIDNEADLPGESRDIKYISAVQTIFDQVFRQQLSTFKEQTDANPNMLYQPQLILYFNSFGKKIVQPKISLVNNNNNLSNDSNNLKTETTPKITVSCEGKGSLSTGESSSNPSIILQTNSSNQNELTDKASRLGTRLVTHPQVSPESCIVSSCDSQLSGQLLQPKNLHQFESDITGEAERQDHCHVLDPANSLHPSNVTVKKTQASAMLKEPTHLKAAFEISPTESTISLSEQLYLSDDEATNENMPAGSKIDANNKLAKQKRHSRLPSPAIQCENSNFSLDRSTTKQSTSNFELVSNTYKDQELPHDEISLMEASLSEFDSDVSGVNKWPTASPLSFKHHLSKHNIRSQYMSDIEKPSGRLEPTQTYLDDHSDNLLSRHRTFQELKEKQIVKSTFVYVPNSTDSEDSGDDRGMQSSKGNTLSQEDIDLIQKMRKVKKKLNLDYESPVQEHFQDSLPFQSPLIQVSESVLSTPVHISSDYNHESCQRNSFSESNSIGTIKENICIPSKPNDALPAVDHVPLLENQSTNMLCALPVVPVPDIEEGEILEGSTIDNVMKDKPADVKLIRERYNTKEKKVESEQDYTWKKTGLNLEKSRKRERSSSSDRHAKYTKAMSGRRCSGMSLVEDGRRGDRYKDINKADWQFGDREERHRISRELNDHRTTHSRNSSNGHTSRDNRSSSKEEVHRKQTTGIDQMSVPKTFKRRVRSSDRNVTSPSRCRNGSRHRREIKSPNLDKDTRYRSSLLSPKRRKNHRDPSQSLSSELINRNPNKSHSSEFTSWKEMCRHIDQSSIQN
ncbi:rho GTPase-activating protein gacU-like [Physella acuta]|uniref:rho GTPase-activating protein gacU-like n=1 Tax=Physella acuta TaxID=109671 RepID=UPI0027DBFC01|nr:rho GTPase-activating protein gacU-like [Physella acuta]